MKRFIVLIAALIVIAIGITITILLVFPHDKSEPPTSNVSQDNPDPLVTLKTLDSHGDDIPYATRQAIVDWLKTEGGIKDLSDSTANIRNDTYARVVHDNSNDATTTVSFLLDITGTPKVTYAVIYEGTLLGTYNTLYITCPQSNQQIGSPLDCHGMTQL